MGRLVDCQEQADEGLPNSYTHDYVKKILTYWWTNRYLWAR